MLQHFLSFDKLIGTKLIKILYYVGLAGIILAGLGSLFAGFKLGIGAILGAIIGTIAGILFWRFICEIFRMSDDLRDIKNHQLGLEANTKDVDIDL